MRGAGVVDVGWWWWWWWPDGSQREASGRFFRIEDWDWIETLNPQSVLTDYRPARPVPSRD